MRTCACEDTRHNVVIDGCIIDDKAFVDIGATLLNSVIVDKSAFIAIRLFITKNIQILASQVFSMLEMFCKSGGLYKKKLYIFCYQC